ncbi:MAG: gliding motility protein GldM [Bacteroidia bacterium]|nr:gliding motility protein GldM [Bacteroidia bacterium]
MASGNLSPRQKMINMMYLVLTALLALNVSAEILEAFESLRSSLEVSAGNFSTANADAAQRIRDHIQKEIEGDDHSHEPMLARTNEITSSANEMVTYIEELTGQLKELGKWDEEKKELVQKDERDKNYRFWMGVDDLANDGKGNGEAQNLRTKLENYVRWANEFVAQYDSSENAPHFPNITELNGNGPSEAESAGKSWEYRTFHDKPIIADLAMLEKFKMDIRQTESRLLDQMVQELQPPININRLIGFAAPVSEIVPAGTYFEAKIFPTLASANLTPEFIGNGITVDKENASMATIKIPASASSIAEGKSDGIQTWRAMIKVPLRNGKFEDLPIEGKFTVRKPEVVIRSRAVQVLYKDCGNEISVDVPALQENYNPDFGGSAGGRIIPVAGSKKDITIVPSARHFDLAVASNTNGQRIKIDNIKYNVIKPPKPSIEILGTNGQAYNGISAISKRGKVKIRVRPDEDFKAFLPKDARYRVKSVKLLYQSGMLPPKTITVINTTNMNIMNGIEVNLYEGDIRQSSPGDRVYIEIDKVFRVNFQNEEVEEPIPLVERMIKINLGS